MKVQLELVLAQLRSAYAGSWDRMDSVDRMRLHEAIASVRQLIAALETEGRDG